MPGVGKRMAHEFEEYRPYKSIAQWRREIGKYVDDDELARLEQYVFVPLELNSCQRSRISSRSQGSASAWRTSLKNTGPTRAWHNGDEKSVNTSMTTNWRRLERYVFLEE